MHHIIWLQKYVCMPCENMFSPRYLRFGVISIILQAQEKLVCILFACSCFMLVFNNFERHKYIWRLVTIISINKRELVPC